MTDWNRFAVTAKQMRAIDDIAVKKYGLQLIQMMENAGRGLAELARTMAARQAQVQVLCGTGNNGGGGMVAARHLHNWGYKVQVVLVADANRLKEIPARQWKIIKAMGLVSESTQRPEGALLIDAMLGYGVQGNPRAPISSWIELVNQSGIAVLSLDLPSGLDATTGMPGSPCIRAKATLTLALPKTGLLTPEAKPFVGELYLADIGIPRDVYREVLPQFERAALFESGRVIRI